MLDHLLFDSSPKPAVNQPRFHHQWMPDVLQFEDRWADESTIAALQRLGHSTGRRADVGVVQMITIDSAGIRAASDPRKGGRPAGR
jgi:gamma-glutamyltranspeptidase/glutathione hydrolase